MRLGTASFDTGAQYVTVRSTSFQKYVDELVGSGYATPWVPRGLNGEATPTMQQWFVGTPGMSSILRPLAESVRIHTSRRVHTMKRGDKGWMLWFEDESSAGPFHAVVCAVPAREALLLLGRIEKLADYATVPSMRCYVLLEQTAVAATLFQREAGGPWTATPHTDGALVLPGLDIAVPMADLYRGLTFPG